MKTIQDESHRMSRELAKTRGVFPNWEKSIYGPQGKNVPMRNAALTNVAPTGTTVRGAISIRTELTLPFDLTQARFR